MPVTAFNGRNYNDIFAARFKTIEYARDGFAFGHATESGTIGLREGAKINADPTIITEHRNRELIDDYLVKCEIPFLQTTISELYNSYILSRGHLSARFTDVNDRVFNFVENTALTGDPNGSQIVSMGFKFVIDMKKRLNTWMMQAQLSKKELKWMFAHLTAQLAVSSGGSGALMDAMAYNFSNYTEANFTDIKVNGNSIGVFGDPKIEISTVSQRQDFRQREINRFIRVNAEFVIAQTSATALLASATNADQDNTVEFFTPAGETYRLNDGAGSLAPKFELSEKDQFATMSIKGDIPYNPNEGSPAYCDFGVSDPSVVEFNFV